MPRRAAQTAANARAINAAIANAQAMAQAQTQALAQARAQEQRARAVEAAVEAQAAARREALRTAVDAFWATNCTRANIQTMGFNESARFIQGDDVRSKGKRCVTQVMEKCHRMHSNIQMKEMKSRIFLSAYLIICYPNSVFEELGHVETSLLEASVAMINAFDAVCQQIHDGLSIPPPMTRTLLETYNAFMQQFMDWKIPDEINLLQRIEYALIAHHESKRYIFQDSQRAIEKEAEIESMRQKYLQLADRERLHLFESRISEYTSIQYSTDPIHEFPVYKQTNDQLAHEILINPAFKYEFNNSINENANYKLFHNAFWNSQIANMRTERPCYARIIRVLNEIRDRLLDSNIWKGIDATNITAQINDILDVDFITTQINNRLFNWDRCRNLASSIITLINRVGHASETNSMWTSIQQTTFEDDNVAICTTLRFVYDRVELLNLDATNARVAAISEYIIVHGADYESKKFQEKLDANTVTLAKTTAWLRSAIEQPETNMQLLRSGNAAAYINLIHRAMVALAIAGPRLATLPETMQFDIYRLDSLHKEFRYITLAATAVTTLAPLSQTETNFAALRAIADTLATADKSFTVDDVVAIVTETLDATTTLAPTDRAILLTRVRHNCTVDNPVAALTRKRVASLWVSILDQHPPAEPCNLACVYRLRDRIVHSAQPFLNMANKNQQVHATRYNGIIAAAVAAV